MKLVTVDKKLLEKYNGDPQVEEDYALLLEAYERLEKHGDEPGIPMAEVMAHHGISEEDLDQIGDAEIE